MGFSVLPGFPPIRTSRSILHHVVDEASGKRGLHKAVLDSSSANIEYLREVRMMQRLDHPRIPKVLETNARVENRDGFVMEWIQATSLGTIPIYLRFQKEPSLLRPLILQVLDILEYLHSKELIHGDIKPDNILMNEELEVFLIDFGKTAAINGEETIQGHPLFTKQNLPRLPHFDLSCLVGSIVWWMVDPMLFLYGSVRQGAQTLKDDGINSFVKEIVLNDSHPCLESVSTFRKAFEKIAF